MKSFSEYITEKEELETSEELNEDVLTVAGTVLGYTSAGLLITWGASLLVRGYVSLMQNTIKSVVKTWKKLFGNKAKANDAVKTVRDLRQESTVRVAVEKSKTERERMAEKLQSVYDAIEEKDDVKAKEELKNSGVSISPIVNRVIVGEIVRVMGPPIHYGNTGNESYLFMKKLLGIKTAQLVSKVVEKTLKDKGDELIQELE